MRTIRRGVVGAALAVLATAAPTFAGRAAELGERLRKAIHARSTGFFAGASFEGATVQPDRSAIRVLHGPNADSRDVLLGTRYAVPASGRPFVNVLTTYSAPPKKR